MNFPLLHATVTSSHMSLCTAAGTTKYLCAHKPHARNKTIPQPVFKNSIRRAATVPNTTYGSRVAGNYLPQPVRVRVCNLPDISRQPFVISRHASDRPIQIRNERVVVVARKRTRAREEESRNRSLTTIVSNFFSRAAFQRVTYER